MNNNLSKSDRIKNWKKGMIAASPLCLGYIAVSFTFGISAQSVLTPGQASLMSATCLSSSGQFASLSIILVSAPLWELALAQFIINARYALMSCAISQKLGQEIKTSHRLIIACGVTDEVFGIISDIPGKLNLYFLFGMVSLTVPSWVLGTFIGSVAHDFLPQVAVTSLGVAFYGMFIAVIIPPTKKNRILMVLVCVSMIISCLFNITPILGEISPGIKIIILTIVITSVVAYLFPVNNNKENNQNESITQNQNCNNEISVVASEMGRA